MLIMKNTIIALLALAGVASAETALETTPLDVLNDTYGTLIGSRDNTATEASGSIGPDSAYTGLTSLLVNNGEWYVVHDFVDNLDVYNPTAQGDSTHPTDAVTLVAGGPSSSSASGAIKFTLDAATIAQYEGAITLSFDVSLGKGKNSKNHAFTFALLGNLEGSDFKTSVTYNSKSGDNLLTAAAQTVELTLTAEQVGAMQAAGTDQTLVFLAASDQVTGSNQSVAMNNFALKGQKNVPEPATATLSLLALAGSVARRRRK